MAAGCGVYRVVDEIRPHLIQLTAVAFDLRQIIRHAHIDLDLLAPGLRAQHRDGVVQAPADRDRLQRGLLIDVGEAFDRSHQRMNA